MCEQISCRINGDGFSAKNIIFENSYGTVCLALYVTVCVNGDKVALCNVKVTPSAKWLLSVASWVLSLNAVDGITGKGFPTNKRFVCSLLYKNTGAGVCNTEKVKWEKQLSDAEAEKYQTEMVLNGWKPESGQWTYLDLF